MVYISWHELFRSRIGNDEGNKNTSVYSTAWSQATSNEAKMTMLANDPNTAIFAVDVDNKIITLHSFHNFGGSVLNPTNKFGALIGQDRRSSSTKHPSPETRMWQPPPTTRSSPA